VSAVPRALWGLRTALSTNRDLRVQVSAHWPALSHKIHRPLQRHNATWSRFVTHHNVGYCQSDVQLKETANRTRLYGRCTFRGDHVAHYTITAFAKVWEIHVALLFNALPFLHIPVNGRSALRHERAATALCTTPRYDRELTRLGYHEDVRRSQQCTDLQCRPWILTDDAC
jgi:hypothetical protein